MRINLLFVFIIGLCISSCGNRMIDITPPLLNVIEYIPAPVVEEICGTQEESVFILKGGEQFSFDVIFEDDEALSQYKVDLHNNFDCHGHGGGAAPSVVIPNVQNQTIDWTVLEIKDISGTETSVFEVLDVPENVTAGNYHFHLQVIDETGNDSPFANFFSMKVTNPLDSVPPSIIMDESVIHQGSIKRGENIRFKGQVTDERSLSNGGNGILYLAYTDLSTGNTFTTNEAFAFDENVDKIFDFDFEYSVPSTIPEGSYRFSLGANDGVRNVASFVFFEYEVT